MLTKKLCANQRFRTLSEAEVDMIAGSAGPVDPRFFDPITGEARYPTVGENGQIISDDMVLPGVAMVWGDEGGGDAPSGNNIIVSGTKDSSSTSNSSASGSPMQGYDLLDPTSDLAFLLARYMWDLSDTYVGLYGHNNGVTTAVFIDSQTGVSYDLPYLGNDGPKDGWYDEPGVQIAVNASGTSGTQSDGTADIYGCIGGGELLIGGVCAGTGAFDLYVYAGVGVGLPLEALVGGTADSDALLTGTTLEATSIHGGGMLFGTEASGIHIGTPGASITHGLSMSDLLKAISDALADAREQAKVEQAIKDAKSGDEREQSKVEQAIEDIKGDLR